MTAVGMTGTRRGMTAPQVAAFSDALLRLAPAVFHHGDCLGADAEGAELANSVGSHVIAHPPDNSAYRAYAPSCVTVDPLPYRDRNQTIVDASDVLIAAPDGPERDRSGTWMTVRMARKARIPIIIVWPDGTTTEETP